MAIGAAAHVRPFVLAIVGSFSWQWRHRGLRQVGRSNSLAALLLLQALLTSSACNASSLDDSCSSASFTCLVPEGSLGPSGAVARGSLQLQLNTRAQISYGISSEGRELLLQDADATHARPPEKKEPARQEEGASLLQRAVRAVRLYRSRVGWHPNLLVVAAVAVVVAVGSSLYVVKLGSGAAAQEPQGLRSDFPGPPRPKPVLAPCNEARSSGGFAWSITLAAFVLDIVVVVAIWAWWLARGEQEPRQRDYVSPLGWAAAVSAALVFGFSEVPIKVPGSQEAGPTLFNSYGFIGNGLVHCLLASILYVYGRVGTVHLHWTGVLAAFNIMIVQAFARSAIWLLGIAAGPPLWCAVGMATSFAWGTLVFGDRPSKVGLSLLGLAMLVAGVALVSRAGYLSCKLLQEGRDGCRAGPSHGGREAENAGGGGLPDLAIGVLYALGAGVADGSLVAFYQHLEKQGALQQGSQGSLANLLCSYFASFGIVTLLCGLLLAVVAHTVNHLTAKRRGAASAATFTFSSFASGMISGSMWAGANSCSVLASHFLGMAVAFPITQTAAAFSGLLGVFAFGEIVGCRARSTFAAALLAILAGAVVLAKFGQPAAAHP